MARKLMVDVTTLLAEAGRIAHGTTRVERGIVGGLLGIEPADLGFCRFNSGRQRFEIVAHRTVGAALARPVRAEAARAAPQSEAGARLITGGKRIERAIRNHVGDPVRRRLNEIWRRIERPRLPRAVTFVLVGEIRFDVPLMAEMVERSRAAFVPTIFDVLPIEFARNPYSSGPQQEILATFDLLFRLSGICLCISQATARDVAEYASLRGFECPACEVIPLADDLPAPEVGLRPCIPIEPGGYVLAVGSITTRKNQALLVDVWKHFLKIDLHKTCKLVLVGGVEPDSFALIRDIRAEPNLSRRIVIVENANDQLLAWLYANCRFSVFPSLLEGFGLPVAESLGAGKLCVASCSSAIPEAAQGQAILLPPTDTEKWIATISRLIEDDQAIREAEVRIAAHYRRQTWSGTATRILDILQARGLRERPEPGLGHR